ncbi:MULTISPECIES: DUF1707 domain-containing protein [Actinokineospora]|uniref:Membrane protein n=1 Tax=Actinokineospora fastidiosa TaxID=1816 RepID=A0A918GSY1_9PSEU|nr:MULTISPECIES: DUF1707 domain-containing protein [Actinokineospora]UVS78335.1 TM2 domain protein [Actinokineospora sp. UTMC 2448]GGS59128.1 membrane protein [Actinokineospora fastidiosa]
MNEPGGDALRIGTAEREDAMRLLGEHFAAGRLQMGEYEQRLDAVTTAVTRGDLRGLFADLPPPYPAFMAPPLWAAPPPRPMPAYPPHTYPAPAAYDPNRSPKSKLVAGLLQICLPFGVGRFYTGHHGIAIAQLLTCGGLGIWSMIDGIILLVTESTDAEGRRLQD